MQVVGWVVEGRVVAGKQASAEGWKGGRQAGKQASKHASRQAGKQAGRHGAEVGLVREAAAAAAAAGHTQCGETEVGAR